MDHKRDEPHHTRAKKRHKSPAWRDLVTETTVKDLLKGKKALITLRSHDTVKHALGTLSDNKILSAPVLEEDTGKFLGFVDAVDIVGYTISVWRHQSSRMDDEGFDSDDFFLRPISRVLNFSSVDAPVTVTPDTSLRDVIETFCDPQYRRRLHRVAVVRKSRSGEGLILENLISQSDVIRFAQQHADSIPSPAKQERRDTKFYVDETVGSMSIAHSTLMVFIDNPLIDALEVLYRNRVSGIALVDREFHVSANLSASDLRGMGTNAFRYFNGSTLQFLVKATDAKLSAPVTVAPANTLRDVLNSLVENRIHRVYVTNENSHITGLISQRDILPLLRV